MDAYNLHDCVKNGYVYMEIRMGLYGLPQAGMLANKFLKENLALDGYCEVPHTPGLWKHFCRPILFTLVVDFGVKFQNIENANHLLTALKKHYEIEVGWKGILYCGITLDWTYNKRYVNISMPSYVHKQLQKYDHELP